jgi:hypothetical protein
MVCGTTVIPPINTISRRGGRAEPFENMWIWRSLHAPCVTLVSGMSRFGEGELTADCGRPRAASMRS